jgi:nicotinamidase-related amidase
MLKKPPSPLKTLPTEPYPIEIALEQSALVIVDMQNDFCSEGGWAHLAWLDIGRTSSLVPRIKDVLAISREIGMFIIYTREGHLPDLSDCPENKQRKMRQTGFEYGPKGPKGKFFVRGTWNNKFVDPMKPLPNELIINKPGN